MNVRPQPGSPYLAIMQSCRNGSSRSHPGCRPLVVGGCVEASSPASFDSGLQELFGECVAESQKAVFLSYASQDAEAARRICEALRKAGIEVWFDQRELRGGDGAPG